MHVSEFVYMYRYRKEVSGKCGTTDHRLQCGSVMVMVTELVVGSGKYKSTDWRIMNYKWVEDVIH